LGSLNEVLACCDVMKDNNFITKEEFEQKKIDLLLEEKQLIRNEDLAALPVFHPNSQKEEKGSRPP